MTVGTPYKRWFADHVRTSILMSSRVIIVGGGVIGVSTLYELSKRGIPATLLEANAQLALEASYANGSMITPSMSNPWNSPGVWRHLAASLFEPNAPMKLRWKMIPRLTPWGLKFLRNSSHHRSNRAMMAVFALANYSAQATHAVSQDENLDFGYTSNGTLKIFEELKAFRRAVKQTESLIDIGLSCRILAPHEVVQIEPLLEHAKERIVGAIYYPSDRCGDARRFTLALSDAAVEAGGEFKTGICVQALEVENGAIVGVKVNGERLEGEQVIVCAGIQTPILARTAGLSLPIEPVKGYSLTFELQDRTLMPSLPVLDETMHAAIVPIGEKLRAVGTAEFTGRDCRLSRERIDNLLVLFRRLYPSICNQLIQSSLEPWTNFRPLSADGIPFIGEAVSKGLYFNTGHGYLGWTMAMGSARLLVDLIEGKPTPIDPLPYRVDR